MKGKTNHPLFDTWRGMIDRCYRPSVINYPYYGGRGITVCDRWRGVNGFDNFVEDMREKPEPSHTLDRIDNDKNYSPENCKWSSKAEQSWKRRLFTNNTTGVRGVIFDKKKQRYIARISVASKRILLGQFENIKDAAEARALAESKYYE